MGFNNTKNMGESTAQQNPFFMTRQIANILDDLDRQVSMPATISVLHGQNGVGKTRLLQYFLSSRLQNVRFILLCFYADGSCTHDDVRYSQVEFSQRLAHYLEHQCVLILDQFENATSDVLRDTLRFWPDINHNESKLILCGNSELFRGVATLSSECACKLHSAELKPLTPDNRIDYLVARICTSSGESYPEFTRVHRELIAETEGLFSELDGFYRRYGKDIQCKPMGEGVPASYKFWFLMLLASAIFIGWLSFDKIRGISSFSDVSVEELSKALPEEPLVKEETFNQQGSAAGPEEESTPDTIKPMHRQQQQLSKSQSSKPGPTLEKQTVVAQPVQLEGELLETQGGPLERRLQATKIWLSEADDNHASIQIMTLVLRSNDIGSIRDFLKKIATAGIDLQNIYIYAAPKSNLYIYGLLYGSYAEKKDARQNMNNLPPVLGADKPIIRTVNGIRQEIQRNSRL